MSTPATIINCRNMTTVYAIWFAMLGSAILYGVAAYALQYTTPFMIDKSTTLLIWSSGVAGVCAVLALLFKYAFKQEIIAWMFLEGIGIVGFILFLAYGWNLWFYSFSAAQFILLFILGPYLHFD